ncbi:MAG: ERF family protein [Patescibacteria group bacterium]|nr:ERF family protein [Patescibacteria group bacterium]MDE2438745.1 ERF family protein [Patescibacteria group bacterium]
MKKSESIKEIAKALSKFQGMAKDLECSGRNRAFGGASKYMRLEDMINGIKHALSECGLSITQEATTDITVFSVAVTTTLWHESGEWMEFGPLCMPVSAGKKDAHGLGGAITYCKRYALSSALGIVEDEEDKDGNGCVDFNRETGEMKKEEKKSPNSSMTDSQKNTLLSLISQNFVSTLSKEELDSITASQASALINEGLKKKESSKKQGGNNDYRV